MTAILTINQKRLSEQAAFIQSKAPVIAVVKNDAYNHGLKRAFDAFFKAGIRSFATTSMKEAIQLRQWDSDCLILLLNQSTDFEAAKKHTITLSLPSLAYYNTYKENLKGISLQLVFRNSLNRSGFTHSEEMKRVFEDSSLTVNGLWTHFAFAYDLNDSRYDEEVKNWQRVLHDLKDYLPSLPYIHSQNSASLMREGLHKEHTHSRCGAILYGTRPFIEGLEPATAKQAVQVQANVIECIHLKAGQSTGYSAAFTANEDTYIAVCDIGYGNGLIKAREDFPVKINQKYYSIASLMMSHLLVEVDETVSVGDTVYLYDDDLRFDSFTHKGIGSFSEQMAGLNKDTFKIESVPIN